MNVQLHDRLTTGVEEALQAQAATARPVVPVRGTQPDEPSALPDQDTYIGRFRELLEAAADLPARFEIAADDAAIDARAVQQWTRFKAARAALISRHADQ